MAGARLGARVVDHREAQGHGGGDQQQRPGRPGQRYVEFVAQLEQRTGGQVDSVCYYALPRVNDRETAYNISRAEAEQIGARRRSHHCP